MTTSIHLVEDGGSMRSLSPLDLGHSVFLRRLFTTRASLCTQPPFASGVDTFASLRTGIRLPAEPERLAEM